MSHKTLQMKICIQSDLCTTASEVVMDYNPYNQVFMRSLFILCNELQIPNHLQLSHKMPPRKKIGDFIIYDDLLYSVPLKYLHHNH